MPRDGDRKINMHGVFSMVKSLLDWFIEYQLNMKKM